MVLPIILNMERQEPQWKTLTKWHGIPEPGDMMSSDANVVVSDVHYFVRPILAYIPKSHWAYGMTAHQIYRCLFDRYIRLKPDIQEEIQQFYDEYMKDSKPLLGVHIRGGDKVKEVEKLSNLNKRYHRAIQSFVRKYGLKILLLTDCRISSKIFRNGTERW